MEGFLLGLANGITCVTSCALVMIPFFLGEGRRVKHSCWLLIQFLLGRFIGYLLFGLLAGFTGQLLFTGNTSSDLLFGGVNIILGCLMLLYGLSEFIELPRWLPFSGKRPATGPGCALPVKQSCGTSEGCLSKHWSLNQSKAVSSAFLPLSLGFLTGLNLCLPFVAAFTRAAEQVSITESVLFFATFFTGTAVFFLPIPFVGTLSSVHSLRTVGKFSAVFVALYYLYTAIPYCFKGFNSIADKIS